MSLAICAVERRFIIAISVAIYRGAKCATLKTAGKTAEEGAEGVPVKQPKIGHFLRGRSLKGRCNICVYVPVCVPVCVPRLPPMTSPILWG